MGSTKHKVNPLIMKDQIHKIIQIDATLFETCTFRIYTYPYVHDVRNTSNSSITRGVAINYLKLNEQGIFFWGCRDNDKC